VDKIIEGKRSRFFAALSRVFKARLWKEGARIAAPTVAENHFYLVQIMYTIGTISI
jgi:hypothetical protein